AAGPPAAAAVSGLVILSSFGALSGIDTVQAALQVIASPQRLRYDGKDGVRSYLRELTPIAPRSLQYRELARRLPGQPQLPDSAGDALDRVPACWIQLRFRDAAAFGRILDLYDRKGRALLAVTAPGLALPSPELKFREMTGVDLRKAAEGCASGELLIGDPYLGLAPRLVLILQFPDARSASERAGAWTTPAGADRVHASFELAMVATTADAIAEVRPILCGGEAGGLKFQPDFLYASLLKLHGDDGRLFVSEAAVKVLVSPAFWIGSHRRTDCLAELADLEAADAFGRLTQRPLPVDAGGATRAALERQWLAPNGQCRSRGAISRTNDGLFACSVHGTRRAPRPLRDAELDPIASSEKSAYSDFAWRYGWLYSTWIDPICIAIEAGPERAVLETAILPVAQQPAYQTLLSWNRRVDRGERRRPIALPRGYDQAVVAVAARLPVDDEDWRWNPRFNMFYGRYYFQEPALWRLRELEKPSPLGNSLGLMLFAGDLEFLRQPGLLLHSKVPAPMAMTREVVSAERARRWLSELMGENGHWSQGSAEGFGFRAAGELSVHAAIDDRALVLATSREKAKELMAAPARSGSLPGAGGWVRLRPGALWESARAFRSLGAGFLANRCRAILASRQNALDLGVALSAKPDCPTGDPFVEPGATCPAGGKYDTDGPLARCSLHGTMELPLDPPPAEDSPLGALLRSAGALEAEAAALDDGVLTRVVLESR
ncbi:MAG: hypothetical protein HY303_06280, partial [Candidatus Wallbacteria bacterium]|nr:hypothetical protein [Candidatus Wallbacteria bacterium]